MIINLADIPQQGKEFILNEKTGDLKAALKDLIGNRAHSTQFSIVPMTQKGSFELRGSLKTSAPELCSRCGLDFDLKINQKFYEILIPKVTQGRDEKNSRTNHYSDMAEDGPSTVEYSNNSFDAGEYFHELIGLSLPVKPVPEVDENEKCRVCEIPVQNIKLNFEDQGFEKPESKFSILKDFKGTL